MCRNCDNLGQGHIEGLGETLEQRTRRLGITYDQARAVGFVGTFDEFLALNSEDWQTLTNAILRPNSPGIDPVQVNISQIERDVIARLNAIQQAENNFVNISQEQIDRGIALTRTEGQPASVSTYRGIDIIVHPNAPQEGLQVGISLADWHAVVTASQPEVLTIIKEQSPDLGAAIDKAIQEADQTPEPEEKLIACANCRSEFAEEDSFSSPDGKETFCQSCYDELYTYCQKCEEPIELEGSETHDVEGFDGHYCHDCYSDKFRECESCRIVGLADETYSCGDTLLCESCYSEQTTCCEGCNETVWNDDAHYDEDEGCSYCESCLPEQEAKPDYDTFNHSETFIRNPSRRFVGFELEFLHKKDDEAELDRQLAGFGDICCDGSLNTDDSDFDACAEFRATPANGDKLLERIDAICDVFNGQFETGINESCGFHVHLDVSGLTEYQRSNIFYWFQTLEPIFFGLVPPSRCGLHYCQSIKDKTPTRDSDNRYRTLNTASLSKHGTFEIRIHSGTTNPVKIKNWVILLLNFFETFKDIDATRSNRYEVNSFSARQKLIFLFQTLKLPLRLKKYLVKRIDQQNKRKESRRGGKLLAVYGLDLSKKIPKQFDILQAARETIIPYIEKQDNAFRVLPRRDFSSHFERSI